MIPTKLSARLQCIANRIPVCDRLIDVGSDHGFLSSYALETKRAYSVIATDIHRAPAERTGEYLSNQGFANQADVFCRDGLSGIKLRSGDAVVIAGMGGLEIIRILESAMTEHDKEIPHDVSFLLQPQRSEEELRTFLCENGFNIYSEEICFDRGRSYLILLTRYSGKPYAMSFEQIVIGPFLCENRSSTVLKYLRERVRSLEKQRLGRPELEPLIERIKTILNKEGEIKNE